MAVQVIGGATNGCVVNFKRQVERAQDANRLFDNFGADAVAWQYCNFVRHVASIQK